MKLDSKLAELLSSFFADAAKVFYAATFISPAFLGAESTLKTFQIILKGLLNVVIYMYIAWYFAKIKDQHD